MSISHKINVPGGPGPRCLAEGITLPKRGRENFFLAPTLALPRRDLPASDGKPYAVVFNFYQMNPAMIVSQIKHGLLLQSLPQRLMVGA